MFKAEQPLKQEKGITVSSTVAETIIGSETRYKGTVSTSKAIRVDGFFEGEIKSGGVVIVGETGQFKGTMSCMSLFMGGQVEGTVTVQGRLECTASGRIKGDLTVKELILAEGAVFDGTCNMSKFNASKEE
jgi:cytoskeletal protein CcmA (bactofilin family)